VPNLLISKVILPASPACRQAGKEEFEVQYYGFGVQLSKNALNICSENTKIAFKRAYLFFKDEVDLHF